MNSDEKTNQKGDHVVYGYATNVPPLEEENRILRETVENLKEELSRFKRNPLMVCEVSEIVEDGAIIRIPNGNSFLVSVSSDCKDLRAGDWVVAEQKNLTVIRKINDNRKFDVEKFVIIKKPDMSWADIGGLEEQIEEIKEVIEAPLLRPDLFLKVGIQPPKGILLYGEPGTGKTILAKAVAASTNSTFIEVVGSELIQKFIGEGAKLIKEIFQLARERAPSVVFIDELDALAATRMEVGTSGEREVQRTFMQLLAEIDGFKPLGNVKIIGCTNRREILDPAITRPGRLDRLIKVPLPNERGRMDIFNIHTKNMKLDKKTSKDEIIKKMGEFSGAEIKAVCTEAGYFAIRQNRYIVTQEDFLSAIEKVRREEESEGRDYLRMFG
jgi:proteasome regulatory subunit